MTQKEAIINTYDNGFVGGCTAICTSLWLSNQISEDRYRKQHRALMASVSSQLRKLVKANILKISVSKTGLRGGQVYEKNLRFPKAPFDQI